jgi:hypothetical protein
MSKWEQTSKRIFEKNYQNLINWRRDHPNEWPMQRNSKGMEHVLAVWFLTLRTKYKANVLPSYALDKLNAIGFPFLPYDYHWEIAYNKLKEWLSTNKKLPGMEDTSLSSWWRNQLYSWERMPVYRRKKLRELGFSELVKKVKEFGSLKKACWYDKFNQLKDYVAKCGEFPTLGTDFPLACWCNNQRVTYSKGTMLPDRIDLLKSLNFSFEFDRHIGMWEKKLENIKEYLKTFGKFPASGKLGCWCSYNRQWFHGHLAKYGPYSEDRKKLLDSLGFDWELKPRRSTKNVYKN